MSNDFPRVLILLCGYPASGKSTLAKRLVDIWTERLKVCLISLDNLQSGEAFDASEWKAARLKAMNRAEKALLWNDICLIDDTMFYRSMRREFFGLASRMNAAFKIIHVVCSVDTCLSRNESRSEGWIPPEVLKKTAGRFEKPGGRFYWESDVFSFYSESKDFEIDVSEIAQRLLRDWSAAVKKEDVPKVSSEASEVHRLDLAMRSAISENIKKIKDNRTKTEISQLAQKLNSLRLKYLSDFKTGSKSIGSVIEDYKDSILKEVHSKSSASTERCASLASSSSF